VDPFLIFASNEAFRQGGPDLGMGMVALVAVVTLGVVAAQGFLIELIRSLQGFLTELIRSLLKLRVHTKGVDVGVRFNDANPSPPKSNEPPSGS